jgi:hypothetical protein
VAENLNGRVVVVREGRAWRAEISEPRALRRARTLYALDRRVREVLGPGWVEYEFHTGDSVLDRLVAGVRVRRRAAQRTEEEARDLTDQVFDVASGLSSRDLGVLLLLSHQRIHQLINRTGRAD